LEDFSDASRVWNIEQLARLGKGLMPYCVLLLKQSSPEAVAPSALFYLPRLNKRALTINSNVILLTVRIKRERHSEFFVDTVQMFLIFFIKEVGPNGKRSRQ
jgi:hypothetical protein